MKKPDVYETLEQIKSAPYFIGQIKNEYHAEPREGQYSEFPDFLEAPLKSALRDTGIHKLYLHQREAIDALEEKKNIIISTDTSSGKSLCFWIPVLNQLLRYPEHRAIALFPTKALARDQLKKLELLIAAAPELLAAIRAAVYDGDTPSGKKKTIRNNSNIILTNPDTLHASILPTNGRWGRFFFSVQYIILDEAHTYRGVFGSHVALVCARFQRLCKQYGSFPQWIMSSATVNNGKELAEKLTGAPFTHISKSTSPRDEKKYIVWKPEVLKQGVIKTGSMYEQACLLLRDFILAGHTSLVFTRTRLQSELLGRYIKESLEIAAPELIKSVAVYRAGYLAKERREIEAGLSDGTTRAVISTSALEAGIDIGHLEAVFIFGFPGSLASFRQRAGRAGRQNQKSVVSFIPSQNPMDQFLSACPSFLYEEPVESVFLDPDNPFLMSSHLKCAAHEYPLSHKDEQFFGSNFFPIIEIFKEEGILKEIKGKWYSPQSVSPAHSISLRSMSEEVWEIVLVSRPDKVIGQVDGYQFNNQIFVGSVYLSMGKTFQVQGIIDDLKQVQVEEVEIDYFTVPKITSALSWDEQFEQRSLGKGVISLGAITEQSMVKQLKRVQFHSGYNRGVLPVERALPVLETTAALVTPSEQSWKKCLENKKNPFSGLIGLRHLLHETAPIVTLSDKSDMRVELNDNGKALPGLALFCIYPGGLGLAEKVFDMSTEIMTFAHRVVSTCACESGCPGCVGYDPLVVESGMEVFPDKKLTRSFLSTFLT
ncbi:MAG: DEAD/DEAH box helicase [Fibrobacteria bacterium]|nr:DEAD/DEAH box helicase [Fibrobacteria bacterium]